MKKITLKQAQAVIDKAEEESRQKRDQQCLERNKKLIGTCWKYSNSYGSGDRWWLYIKVIGTESPSGIICLDIQKTSHDKIEIEVNHRGLYTNDKNLGYDYHKITEKEWAKAVAPILTELDDAVNFSVQQTKRRKSSS